MARIEKVTLWKYEDGTIGGGHISYEDRKWRRFDIEKMPGTAKKFIETAEKVSEDETEIVYAIPETKEEPETISKDEAVEIVNAWNKKIDNFMGNELPELLKAAGVPVKNGKISMNGWFKANEIVQNQNFYAEGHKIQMKLRAAGHDVKMNMQDNTLVFPKWW